MQNEKTSVLVLARCDTAMRERFHARFGAQCTFDFIENGEHPTAEQLRRAAVIIGEPSEDELAQTANLHLLQLTWAGADKYTRMGELPAGMVLANASGAFGTIIAEYVLGSLVALYRAFPRYCRSQQAHIWKKYDDSGTIYGKTALVLGMGDIGANVAHRLKALNRTALSYFAAAFPARTNCSRQCVPASRGGPFEIIQAHFSFRRAQKSLHVAAFAKRSRR